MIVIGALSILIVAISPVCSDEQIMENVAFLSSNYPIPPRDVCVGTEERFFVRNPRGENLEFMHSAQHKFSYYKNINMYMSQFRLCMVFHM